MTLPFFGSDQPVYTIVSSGKSVFHLLLRQWQDLTTGALIHPFQVDITSFTDASTQGWHAHMGDSHILAIWSHTDCKLHCNYSELKAVTLALHKWPPVLQGRQVMVATDNTTVVSYMYINKQEGI